MSTTIKVTGHLYAEKARCGVYGKKDGEFLFSVLPYKSASTDCWGAYIGECQFDYVMPEGMDIEAEAVRQKIATLQKEKEEAGREYAKKVSSINEQLAKLQAITCEVTA